MSERCWSSRLTQDVADEICRYSAGGGAVRDAIRRLGLPLDETMDWLKEVHIEAVRAAKVEQIRGKEKSGRGT